MQAVRCMLEHDAEEQHSAEATFKPGGLLVKAKMLMESMQSIKESGLAEQHENCKDFVNELWGKVDGARVRLF